MSLLKIKPFSIDTTETFVFGNASITGNLTSGNAALGNLVTANYFSGNGSALSSITASNIVGQVANALVAGTVYSSAQPAITSIGTLTSLTVAGATDLGAVANVKITGGSTGYVLKTDGTGNLSWAAAAAGTGNANVGGSNTQIQFNDGTNLSGSANLVFDTTTNTLTVTNIVGNGSGLSAITGANVTGTVASATVAATANAVAGANVTGTVANATFATTAGSADSVAGANVSGAVSLATYATTANSVAGANVSGAVSLATYASTANSVAGANVTGAVSLATYATTANAVAGANVTGTVASATVAGTVTTAAQPNITSLGTLSGLSVSGNVSANYFIGDGSQLTGLPAGYTDANVAAYLSTYTGNLSAGNITTAGSGGNISGVNYVIANVFSGSGNNLSNIQGANVTGAVSLATYATTANSVAGGNVSGQVGNALIAGTVYTAAQPNITSVGTLTSLSVTGSLAAGDATITGNLTVTGTTTTVNSTVTQITDPIVELGSGANGAALTTNDGKERGQLLHYYDGGVKDAFMGWMNTNKEFTFASNVSVTDNTVTVNALGKIKAGDANLGNAVTSNYFIGDGSLLTGIIASGGTSTQTANGTSKVDIATVNGNITMTVGGTSNVVVVSTTGANVNGYLTTSGNITAQNASLGNAVVANYFIGSGANLSAIAGANVTGTVANATFATTAGSADSVSGANVSGQVGNALVAGTVYTNAQPNITSVGTLANLTVSGVTTLGSAANVKISGGSADFVLKTDGTGNLSWTALTTTEMVVDAFTGDGSWTMKTLAATPASIDYTIVGIGGVLQPRSSYSVLADVITFSSPPPEGATVEITTVTGGTGGGSSGGASGPSWTYSEVSAATTAVAGYRYIVDTSASAITITLPSTATLGDEIMIIDGTGNASTNNITVDKNGSKIMGSATNMTVSTDRAAFTLVYYNSTQGWVLTNV